MKAAAPSINDVFERFTAERGDEDGVIELYASYLDGYGHDLLSETERDFWQRRYDADEDAGSFCNLFGPDRILEGLEGFLGWFIIRKVLGPPATIAAAGPVCAELTRWLVEEGFLRPEAADGAIELATTATRDLPLAEELSPLLYQSGEGIDQETVLEFVDWETELAEVARIEPGRLWFRSELGEVGPVVVPPRATEIVGPGWSFSALSFGRTEEGWYILEIGNVYPG